MNEFPSLEMKLISEDSELERGKKRGLEGAIQPPPQQRRQGTARVSSVPPGSSTARARERAAAMIPTPPTGRGTGKGWGTTVSGKLPADFQPMSSIVAFGDTPIEERKKKIFHKTMYDKAWHTLQGMLASLGTSEDNLPAFECTFIHWFSCMENSPMQVSMEALLGKLLEVERDAYFADLPQDATEDVTALHKAIIVDSLTNVKNFMSSFGLSVKDFFDQDKSRFSLQPFKGSKGGKGDQYPALKGKASGKSTNRPKEPTPLSKHGGAVQLNKPLVQPSIPLVLHKPPTKAGGVASIVKHPAIPKSGVESTVPVEPVPKTGSAIVEQSDVKGEAVSPADPPKVKAEATQQPLPKVQPEIKAQQDVPKGKGDAIVQPLQADKEEAKAVEKADQSKSEGQSQPLLSLAGIKGVFGFGPSKPERPPPVLQDDDMTQIEKDEEADLNAAIQASLKAPTSPQVPSGSQSSTLMPTNLDQKESDLMTQLDKLSAEALRLEVITNPSIRDKSRMRTIEGVTDEIVKQLEEIAQQRLQSTSSATVSQPSKVQPATPIAAPPVSKPTASSTSVKMVSPHRPQPLTIEGLMRDISGQQDPGISTGGTLQLAPPDMGVSQPATPTPRAPESRQERSRERTPVRRSRSATPSKEVQPSLPAIEDGPPPRKEVEQEPPRDRERTPPKERSREKKKKRRSPSTSRDRSTKERQRSPTPTKDRSRRSKRRSPSPRRDHASEERQRSPTPPKERSHRRRRHSPSPVRERSSEERRHSPVSSREQRHDRRRRSLTPTHGHLSEERRHSPSPSRDPSRERRRRRRSPEPSEVSREERRRSPSPKVVPSESPKVESRKSKKSGKKEKKDSKGSRRTDPVETVEDKPIRDERSRSTRRPESSRTQPPQIVSVEESETDDRPIKDDRPPTTHDRPARPRPRFDPSREHAVAQRILDNRRVVQPPREHGRDPGTDGPPDIEEEAKQRRRYPPPPPPASSMRQPQTSHRSLAFANPPPRRDSTTESSLISERQPLRVRSHGTPPQRPMPRRVVASSKVGSSAPPRIQDMSSRTHQGEYYDQSQVRDDRTYGTQHHQERQDWGSSQRRVPSMGRRESLHAWAGHQYSGQQYQDWGQQQPSTQEYWHDPQQGHSHHYSQQSVAPQHWHEQQQQQQQLQQQLPTLPTPVFPPGMQPNVQPPPGLGSNVQRTRQGVTSQGASMQYGSAASRQQSPVGSQPPQERQPSSYSQQYPFTSGYFRQGYQ